MGSDAQNSVPTRADPELYYLALIEELPAYLACKDRDGKFTVVTNKFAQLFENTPQEIIGKSDFDFYPQEMATRLQSEDRQVIETGELLITEKSIDDGDRRQHYEVRKSPVHDADGNIVGVQTIFWDITDQKKAEKLLQDERDMLQTIMDNLPDFIYVKDSSGKYVVVNQAVQKILGAGSVDEVVGKTNFDFLPHEQADPERADDNQVISTGQPLIEREERMSNQEGDDIWILTSKLPLRDSAGKVTGLVGIDRDITHLKATESELRAAKDTADLANRAKGDFLANMSHEIRTPMNAIIGMTDLLLETQLSETQREYLNMVQDSGESLLALINDILDFSKIDAGKLELEYAAFDIRESLGDTMKSLGLRAYAKGIELAVNVDNQIPKLLIGDAGRIRQIVVNLVGNAIKFTEKGEVVLEILCESQDEENATLHFSVSDTGIGISPAKCKTVFEEFEQADASTTRRFGGSGLGLAISSRLVGLMGGRIWVDSQEGIGSKFQFSVTLGIDETQRETQRNEQLVVISGLRVLVVDDNATNRRILKDMLTNWGMSPITASGAAQAIQTLADADAEKDPIKFIISDVNMPDVDGIQLAQEILNKKLLDGSSIIMLTSGARPDDANQLREIGVPNHLIKPIKQSELFETIVTSMDQQGLVGTSVDEPVDVLPGAAGVSNLHILLAEDNAINQKLALGILGSLGHHVTVAGNGIEAIQKLDDMGGFDLILMDVQMPEMDGLTATRLIRHGEQQSNTHIPIVAMTAHAMKGDREECLEAGMDDYLTKPIRLQEMAAKLNQLFGSASNEVPSTKQFSNEVVEFVGPKDNEIAWDRALANTGGDQELLDELVDTFLVETPRLIAAGQQAIEAGDIPALAAAAHSLKGSMLFLETSVALQTAVFVEELVQQNQQESAYQYFAELTDQIDKIREAMREYASKRQV